MSVLPLRAPKSGTRFVEHHGRLALFHEADEDRQFWSEYWLGDHTRELLAKARTGSLDPVFDVVLDAVSRHVPAGATILEAGCGPGHAVAALAARGFVATGIDYVPELVAFAKSVLPDLDVRDGNVEALPFADASFDAHASLGVIEHLEGGPQIALAEMRRVTRRGGMAIIEVPFLNALRAGELGRLRRGGRSADGLAFHQYYYGTDELRALVERAGFEIIEQVPNCWEGVLYREAPLFARWWSSRLAITRVRAPIRRIVERFPRALQWRYAHTIVLVCRSV